MTEEGRFPGQSEPIRHPQRLPQDVDPEHQPEGAFVPLGNGEEVSVIDVYATHPVTLALGQSDQGEPIVSFWPGDGVVRVEKGGVDVLDDERVHQEVVDVVDSLQRAAQSAPLPGGALHKNAPVHKNTEPCT